jgi:acyl-CoA thioester hydrolase
VRAGVAGSVGMMVEQALNEAGVEIWRGGVQQWECDQMGHMNVAFYLAKASEALGGLASALGLPGVFRQGAETTLVVRDQHMRNLREARLGAPLHMTGGVIELGETDGRFLLLLHHVEGSLSATFQVVLAHVDVRTGEARSWPAAVRARADALRMAVPDMAAARSCSLEPLDPARFDGARLASLGVPTTTLCLVQPSECDVFGRMRPNALLARLLDGAVHLGRRDEAAKKTFDPKSGIGGAAVEYRLAYFDLPRTGDRMEVRAGWSAVEPRVRHLLYCAFDADTGRPICVADSVTVSFDLNTRKMIVLEGETLEKMRIQVIPGLALA